VVKVLGVQLRAGKYLDKIEAMTRLIGRKKEDIGTRRG